MTTEFHVATTGSDAADGSSHAPFRTIDRAAREARPGDTVTVHAGTYREWVDPRRGGLSDRRRITYRAAEGERVLITGAEPVTGWRRAETGTGTGTVWTVEVPNELFGDFNPFAELVEGDWLVEREDGRPTHLGEVYLDGAHLFEAADLAEVAGGAVRTTVVDHWTGTTAAVADPRATSRRWYAEVGDERTTIWANFQDADPNAGLVEINVRRSVFFPRRTHVDYITVSGFELAQAATPWAPPTADQPGLVGPNWAKGWIIEDNLIHHAKCSGVSLGKEATTGHNFSTERGDKPGYQYQLESVFTALDYGWDETSIGSHVVRRNTIRDCGQNGIVGHLGAVFSTIEHNHIHGIAVDREFYGYEIAGIKLHAAIDVEILGNRIHDCTLGTWLDWQTQGTRLSGNLYYGNSRDLFVEVSHGPYLADHNLFASPASLELFSQGGAFVHNLIGGTVRLQPVPDRATPYHRPHSTRVAGYAVVFGGDDRFIGNLFLGAGTTAAYGDGAEGFGAALHGTAGYDGHPADFDEYLARLAARPAGDHERFAGVPQAVLIRDNVYASGASAYAGERGALAFDADFGIRVEDEGDEVHLVTDLPEGFARSSIPLVDGRELGRVRLVDAEFEDRDGRPVRLDRDLTGTVKETGRAYPAGPLAGLAAGPRRTRVW